MQRAAFGRKIGVTKGAGLEERPAFDRSCRFEQFEGKVALLQPFAIFLRFVAGFARDAEKAARIEMIFAEIGPQLVPGLIGLADQLTVAGAGTVSAADDAVMVAGGGERIGDRPLLDD